MNLSNVVELRRPHGWGQTPATSWRLEDRPHDGLLCLVVSPSYGGSLRLDCVDDLVNINELRAALAVLGDRPLLEDLRTVCRLFDEHATGERLAELEDMYGDEPDFEGFGNVSSITGGDAA